ncbi:exodeoxyribonuclease VII small subunit [Nannocystis pusilla]|uniref:exodeoxyribonuclease VII small subunit n=1 Tax=Nannocystis pusilla TaxID=889268 RepID=UPI003B7E3631
MLASLERVVAELEAGDLPLETALQRFEDGVRLARRGTSLLDAVEQRVEVLLEGRDEAVPFPGPAKRKRVTTMTKTLSSTLTSASAAGWSTRPSCARCPRPAPATPAASKKACATRCCRAASACDRW